MTINKSKNLPQVGEPYMLLIRKFPLVVLSTEKQLAQASEIFSHLTLNSGSLTEDENLYREALGLLIAAYEKQHSAAMVGNPVQIIKDLMQIHNLKQADLVPQFGSRSLVSEFLNGKRELSKEQIIKLCKRFSLSPSSLIPELAQAS